MTDEYVHSRAEWERRSPAQNFVLGAIPTSSREVRVDVRFWTGRGQSRRESGFEIRDFEYNLRAGRPVLTVLLSSITGRLTSKVRPGTNVTLIVVYPAIQEPLEGASNPAFAEAIAEVASEA